MAAQTKPLANKTREYVIDSRVSNELGLTHKETKEILDKFFEVLREECSLLEAGEKISYKWLKVECKQTPDRVIRPGMVGFRGDEEYTVKGKLKLYAKVLPKFYDDPKKGVESNWGA